MFKKTCKTCGETVPWHGLTVQGNCKNCELTEADRRHAELPPQPDGALDNAPARSIILTTETGGLPIVERLGIVTAECACGISVFRDLAAGARNIVGGRSAAIEASARESRDVVLLELQVEAARLGADAVVAVRLDYSEIGGNGGPMILLVASGTAVVLAPRYVEESP